MGQDEHTSRVGELAKVSLNALSGAIKRKSIVLMGNLGGLPVKILVDTGSLITLFVIRLSTCYTCHIT